MEEEFRRYLQELSIRADKILKEEMRNIKADFDVAQVYTWNKKRVGQRGDNRVEGYPVELTLKGIKRTDRSFYTEKEFYDFVDKVSSRIGNEILEILGVVLTTTYKNLDGTIWSIDEENLLK